VSYAPTARAGTTRRQHHGFGQVTIATESVPQVSTDAAIAALATPTSAPPPTTTAYTTSAKSGGAWALPSVPSSKDSATAFAQSTMPGWAASAQVPMAQPSNAPIYIAIGGAIVLFGIILVASRRPAKAVSANRGRRRRRR